MVGYDHAVVLGAGHSYIVDAKYDGDSNHQPASATASIDIKGSTGITQDNSNAGSTQQNNRYQASAATPCDLTVGTPSDEAVPNSILGKLICGGLGIPNATIKISGLPGGESESATTTNGGSYEQGVFSPFSAGQSYTVTAKYDGDSNHQPASATTSINIKGSTGSTQDNSNAGSTQDNSNAGRQEITMLEVDRTIAMLEIQQNNRDSAVSQRTQHFIFFESFINLFRSLPYD